jgi:hypothetical protein
MVCQSVFPQAARLLFYKKCKASVKVFTKYVKLSDAKIARRSFFRRDGASFRHFGTAFAVTMTERFFIKKKEVRS